MVIDSTWRPGRFIICGPAARRVGVLEFGVAIPEAGVDARELPLLAANPLTPLALTEAGLRPQADETAAGAWALGAPRPGNISSDAMLSGWVLDFLIGSESWAFCFPAALSDSGAGEAPLESEASVEEACLRSSSSGTSSTVGLCACCSCLASRIWAGVRAGAPLVEASAVAADIVNR